MIGKHSVIHSSAKIHETAKIGAFVSIGENVEVGARTVIEPYAVIHKNTNIGVGNFVGSYVSLGGASQSKHDQPDDNSVLIIGDNNSFHEFCSINRGSIHSSGKTQIGDSNTFMAYVHVGHDCVIGNNVVLVNQATLAGHVSIMDNSIIGYAVAVRQFCRVGQGAFINGGALVVKDVIPYVIVQANPTRVIGINKIGLERLQFSETQITEIQECYRTIFRRNLTRSQAIEVISGRNSEYKSISEILDMLKNSERGLVR